MNGINVLSVCGGLDRTYQIIQVGLALLCWGGGVHGLESYLGWNFA